MKKIKILYLLLLLLFSNTFSENKIIITVGEWEPYLGSKLPNNGIAGQIITEAFMSQGVTVEFKYLPWKRAMQLAKDGAYQGTAVWLKNSEREKDFYYSNPVIAEKHVLFYHKENSIKWETVSDLVGIKMGGLIGFSYGKDLDKLIKEGKITMEVVSDDETNFKKIITNRIKVYPQELNVGYHILNTKFTSEDKAKVTYSNKAIIEQNSYLLLTKSDKNSITLMEKFNSGLNKLIKEGRIQNIVEKARQIK